MSTERPLDIESRSGSDSDWISLIFNGSTVWNNIRQGTMAENRAEGIVNHGDGLHVRLDGPVNVISGNHNIVQNAMQPATDKGTITSEYRQPVPDPSSSWLPHRILAKLIHTRKFKRLIKDFSWKKTFVKVTENYERENLREPVDVLYPRMRKGIRFYNGEYAHEEGFSVTAPAHRGEIITSQDLVDMITTGEAPGYIAIVGQAGSGKTTTMKRIARSVMVASNISKNPDPCYDMFTNLFRNQKRRYEMLYFLSVKDIQNFSSVGVGELLFDTSLTRESNDVLKYGYSWITQNQSKVIIFLDGLDQATWEFDDTDRRIGPCDRASTSTIMQNLLSRHILPDVQLIVSSREHAVATLPNELRPTNIVALAGLDPRDVEKLFVSVVGIGGKKAWNELARTSPILLRLSSVPLYLIFIAIVWIHCKKHELTPPDSITGVMIAILSIIPHSSHLSVRKCTTEIMQNMKGLAFSATQAKKLTFYIDDLERYGLNASDTSHLIIGVPKETLLSQYLMEGEDYIFFFSHQTLQEIFSALFLADMKGSELKQFVSEKDGIHSNHWSVVRRLLCGILFNPDVNKYRSSRFLRVEQPELQAKQEILRSSLQQQINSTLTEYQRLELYGALYETNDANLIESSVRKIEFSNVEFPSGGMHTMSAIMRRCHYLAILRLVNCNLDKERLDILGSNTAGLKLQVDVLDISGNSMDMDAILAFNVALQNFNVGELIMGNCSLTTSTLDNIAIKNTRVWNLMCFDCTDFELFYAIGKAATRGRLEELRMARWSHLVANKYQVKKLSELQVLGEVDILEIELTGIVTVTISEISSIEKRCRIKEVKANLSGNIAGTWEAISLASSWNISGKVEVLQIELTGDPRSALSAKTSVKERFHASNVDFRLSGIITSNQKTISRLAKANIIGQVDRLETEVTGDITELTEEISLIEKRCQIKEIKARLSKKIVASSEAIFTTARWKVSGEVDILETELTGDITKITSEISSMKNHCNIKEIRARLSGNITASKKAISTAAGWSISGEVDILEIELTGNINKIFSVQKRCRIKEFRAHLSGNIVGTWEAISVASRWKISGKVKVLQMDLTGDVTKAISAKTAIKDSFQATTVSFRLSGKIAFNQETISKLAKENIIGQVDSLETQLEGDITESVNEISSIEKRWQSKEIRAGLSKKIIASSGAIFAMERWRISGEVDILETELTGDISDITLKILSIEKRSHIKEVRVRLSGNIKASTEAISIVAGWKISGEVDILETELTGDITNITLKISSIENLFHIKKVRARLSGNINASPQAISTVVGWKISGEVDVLNTELPGHPAKTLSEISIIEKHCKIKDVRARSSGKIIVNRERFLEEFYGSRKFRLIQTASGECNEVSPKKFRKSDEDGDFVLNLFRQKRLKTRQLIANTLLDI